MSEAWTGLILESIVSPQLDWLRDCYLYLVANDLEWMRQVFIASPTPQESPYL